MVASCCGTHCWDASIYGLLLHSPLVCWSFHPQTEVCPLLHKEEEPARSLSRAGLSKFESLMHVSSRRAAQEVETWRVGGICQKLEHRRAALGEDFGL